MAKKYCDYEGCRNVRNTHGNITFFTLPNDERRSVWVENSGNEALKFIHNKSVRFICEEHFEKKYLRHQFSRTTLSKSAIPIKHTSDVKRKLRKEDTAHICSEFNMLYSRNELQQKDFNIVLRPNNGEKETENFENYSKDYIEYDIEYCANDNSNESQKLNFVEIDPVVNINEIIDQGHSSLYDEENLVEANIFEGIGQIFEYSEEQEEIHSDKSSLIKVEKVYDTNKMSLPLKKPKKFYGMNEIPSCSSNEISSSTIETCQHITDLETSITDSIFLEHTHSKINREKIENSKCIEQSTNTKLKHATKPSTSTKIEDYEDDKHFVLSLVGNFQRLPLQKKALAKVKILQYLTNLEFSDTESPL